MHLHRPQGRGRLDNPTVYDTWYVALSPECAVGEVFGDLSSWSGEIFTVPSLPGGRRALGLYEVDAGIPILDLDDPKVLLERGLRPTQVVSRNRSVSQGWALSIFHETKPNADRRWAGVRWWSFQRPRWTPVGLWVAQGEKPPHGLVDVQPLELDHPAVADAARDLARDNRPARRGTRSSMPSSGLRRRPTPPT